MGVWIKLYVLEQPHANNLDTNTSRILEVVIFLINNQDPNFIVDQVINYRK